MGPAPDLKARLDALLVQTDLAARLPTDPLRFPRRYRDPGDVEVAAVVSASLAFGRVELFGRVLEQLFAAMDAAGGPAAYVDAFEGAELPGYRWLRGPDLAGWFGTLRRARAEGPLAGLFTPGPLRLRLTAAIDRLRRHLPAEASPALCTLLPSPREGSACKRWCMALRWLVRRGEGDLGLWTHLDPADLVIPLDTHVHRVSRFLGLSRRASAGWATAEEITAALRAFAPGDPLRYDFALAHLGISGACRGRRDPEVCPGCPLDPVCAAPGPGYAGADVVDRRRNRR